MLMILIYRLLLLRCHNYKNVVNQKRNSLNKIHDKINDVYLYG